MNRQVLRIAMAGGLLISSALAAQPLKDLQERLAAVRSDQPIRVKVDVELQHKGTAPLHLNSDKQRGRVIIEAGPWGVKAWAETVRQHLPLFVLGVEEGDRS